MLNISDVTSFYIEHKFIDEMKALVLNAFSLMESFQLNFYEDKYIDLICKTDALSPDDVNTVFVSYLVSDLNEIITSHGVTIDPDGQPSLSDIVEVTHGLLLLANLEDYSYVRYRVNTEQVSRMTLVDLLERYTMLSRVRLMEIIGEVKETLIETLRGLTENISDEEDKLDLIHLKHVNRFFKYIEETPCLAVRLKEQGYDVSLTLEELVNLLTFDMVTYIEKTATTNLAQAALDILSLIIYTKDDFTMPVFKFKKHSALFTADTDLTMRIHNAIFAMVNDFTVFLKACEEEEKANAH